jgi:AhpD family alkylhydroperoxidase
MAELERAVHSAALEPELLELLRIGASQINGCTYCLAMHNRDARSRDEHQTRLDTVAAWREAPYYTPRERAALAWCEALTDLPSTGAPDEVYAAMGPGEWPPASGGTRRSARASWPARSAAGCSQGRRSRTAWRRHPGWARPRRTRRRRNRGHGRIAPARARPA